MSINFKINDIPVYAEAGEMISDVAARFGIDIPTLCHDPKVKSYGACGMCVIEAKGGGKLLRSCSTEVNERTEGMEYYTETPRVIQARKVALELLMTDHTGDCRPPCMLACPAETDCQGYVGMIANGMDAEAVRLVMEKIPLPASIGRVCPHPCEKQCRRGQLDESISIAFLKRYVADKNLALGLEEAAKVYQKPVNSTGKKVAIIGGGPAGLTAATQLAGMGHDVTIYEQMPKMGGMLRYGIPEYRLPKAVLDQEIAVIEALGVKAKTGVQIGKDIDFETLRKENDAVIVAIGAWTSSKMRVPGEDLKGVLGGIDFLRDVALGNAPEIGTRVAICGGGNTAMDACRTAVRVGAKDVYTLYRRTRAEMPAEDVEICEAEEEGVVFKFLCNPVEIIGDETGKVVSVKVQKMELGEPDASGRRSPVPVEGAYEIIPVDTVIMAIGQGVNPAGIDGLELTRKNTFVADEQTFATSVPGVFACGDDTNKGPGIAVAAIGEAQKAAKAVDLYLRTGKVEAPKAMFYSKRKLSDDQVKELYAYRKEEPSDRVQMAHTHAEERKNNFKEYMHGFTQEEAQKEAARCLECGCMDYFECKLINYANRYDIDPERFGGYRHDRQMKTAGKYFVRDVDKCVLCGLCARACEEITGKTILGLVGRGFDTIVQPEMGMPLSQTECLACGLCVSVCPTGALTEISALDKQVPVKETVKDAKCVMCQAGCDVQVATCGSRVTRVLPKKGKGQDVLCVRGRFDMPKMVAVVDQVAIAKDAIAKAGDSKVAFLVGTTCSNAQIDAILAIAQNAAFVASNSLNKVIEEGRQKASATYAAVRNNKAKDGEDLAVGFNQSGVAVRGISAISAKEASMLAGGEVDLLITFGEDLSGLTINDSVRVIALKAQI